MRVGSLFSGIGGLDLGFERAGFEIAWQVEIDPYCRKVLHKHWPDVPCYEDVREVGAHNLEPVDVLVGGFPCQDISISNGRALGIDGPKSGLWREYVRVVRLLRPRYVVMENSSMLLHRGLGTILGELAASGYDAEWDCFPAASFGAPHRRDRLFLVAYTHSERRRASEVIGEECESAAQFGADGKTRGVAYAASSRLQERARATLPQPGQEQRPKRCSCRVFREPPNSSGAEWATEPPVGRVANGVPDRVDRLRGLGNAVVPQVAQYVAECVKAHAQATGQWVD